MSYNIEYYDGWNLRNVCPVRNMIVVFPLDTLIWDKNWTLYQGVNWSKAVFEKPYLSYCDGSCIILSSVRGHLIECILNITANFWFNDIAYEYNPLRYDIRGFMNFVFCKVRVNHAPNYRKEKCFCSYEFFWFVPVWECIYCTLADHSKI